MAVIPADIATALGQAAPEPSSAKYEQWSMWIDDAHDLIRWRLGDLSSLDSGKVDYVVREAVAGMARRPDVATQVTTSVDDASVSRTYQAGTGRLTIADELWSMLASTAAAAGAYSVPLGTPWVRS